MEPLPFPGVLDSTMMHSFRSCPRQFWNSYVRRLRSAGVNPHFNAGGAFAKGLEVARKIFWELADTGKPIDYCTGESTRQGLVALWQSYGDNEPGHNNRHKSWDRTSIAFLSYLEHWPLASDPVQVARLNGKRLGEITFAIDLPISHPVSGVPLLYAGKLDWIGDYSGNLFVVDEKTTKYFQSTWANQWTLRAQFPGYVYAAQLYGIPVVGMIVRGTAFKLESIEHAESIMPLHAWRVNRWFEQTLHDVRRMITCWKEDYWDLDLGLSCTAYSGCEFFELCKVQDDTNWIKPEAGLFVPNTWNPLEKEDE